MPIYRLHPDHYGFPERTEFEEDIEAVPFTFIKAYDCSSKRAMEVINQEGAFQPFFQGIIINGRDKFITIGESKEDGYISAETYQSLVGGAGYTYFLNDSLGLGIFGMAGQIQRVIGGSISLAL